MLYKRSSFITFLKEKRDCDIIPLRDKSVILLKNGVMTHYLGVDKFDTIDYEEIWIVCTNLLIVGLPGDSELIRAE